MRLRVIGIRGIIGFSKEKKGKCHRFILLNSEVRLERLKFNICTNKFAGSLLDIIGKFSKFVVGLNLHLQYAKTSLSSSHNTEVRKFIEGRIIAILRT